MTRTAKDLVQALERTRDETLRHFALGKAALAYYQESEEIDKVADHNEHHLKQIRQALG